MFKKIVSGVVMNKKYLLTSLLLSMMMIASNSVNTTPAASLDTGLTSYSLQTPPIDAWLLFDLVEESAIRRALNMTGKPLIELGGGEGTEVFAASTNPEQPWYSEYFHTMNDGDIAVLKVEKNSPTENIPLLRSHDLTVSEKTPIFEIFKKNDQPFMVWSPEGTRLAYIDIPVGKKTRLMIYDTASKTSTLISQATEDVIAPVWSPDGEWLVYQTVDTIKSQGTTTVTGVHVVRSNGSDDHMLYQPSSLREIVLGWQGNNTIVVETMIELRNRDLRMISIKDGTSLSLYPGMVKSAGWDASSNTAMYLLTASEMNNEQPAGVYAVKSLSPLRMILPGKWDTLKFFPHAKTWIAASPGITGIIRPDGVNVTIKGVDTIIDISPDGKYIVGNTSPGGLALFTNEGIKTIVLSEKPARKAYFSPDGQKIYFESANAMFTASAPEWKPQPFPVGNILIGWVGY